jgi:hypothetical protein
MVKNRNKRHIYGIYTIFYYPLVGKVLLMIVLMLPYVICKLETILLI